MRLLRTRVPCLTRQQRKDGLSVAVSVFVQESLSMEVDTLVVSGRTHVNQVPVHELVGVHPQTLQVVYDAIDGWEQNRERH